MSQSTKRNLSDRNRYLQILHKRGLSRSQIDFIMKDIDESGIFDEPVVEEDSFDILEYLYDIESDPNSTEEDIKAARAFVEYKENEIREQQEEIEEETLKYVVDHSTGRIMASEELILAKRRQIFKRLARLEGKEYTEEEIQNEPILLPEFGRNPCHQAVANRDLKLVMKFIAERKYLDGVDNNGNTPREFAFYEGWDEAVILFDEAERKAQ